MSKLEEALRKAKRGHEKIRGHVADGHARHDDFQDTQSNLALVLYRIQAGQKYVPSDAALERNRIIHDGFSSEALTNYKMLRTRILQEYSSHEWKTLAITSPQDGAGKTLTAINLAIALASHGGHNVLLIDLDMRNPSIAEYLDMPAEMPGLSAYFDKHAEISSTLWDIGVENLQVLANRDCMSDSSERITSARMQEMIQILRSSSPKPIIIFDLPPVLTTDDAVAMAPLVDGMLMVVAEGETVREDLAQSLDLLRGANVLGVILNKAGQH